MVRVVGCGIICLVAGITILRSVCVVSADMALIAINIGMAKRERKGNMVEGGRFPPRIGGVTLITDGRKLQGSMIRVCGCIIVGLMTGNTLYWCIRIIPVMAFITIHIGMTKGKRKSVMFKIGWSPSRVSGVTLITGDWKVQGIMIRIAGCIVIGLVARNTICRKF
jgi:hypothetical protein